MALHVLLTLRKEEVRPWETEVRTHFWTSAVNIFLGLALSSVAAAQAGSSAPQPPASATPDLGVIVSHLEQAQVENRAATRAYVVTRDYQLFKEGDHQPQSTVIAEVSFVPPGTKKYEIRQASGSGQGEKLVRKVLIHEQEMAKDNGEHDLSSKNYDFAYAGMQGLDGVRCYVLHLHPRRDDKNLIEGLAWIDANTYMPRRIVGTPAKNPSWWVKNLRVEMDYAPIAGMWLPIGSRAEADVRIVGKHTFIARDVQYQTAENVARVNGPQRLRPGRTRRPFPATNAGAILMPE